MTLSELQHGIDRMRAAAEGKDDPLAADIAFHVAVLNATNNPFYMQLRGLVNTALRISIRYANREAQDASVALSATTRAACPRRTRAAPCPTTGSR